uniref:Transmembrane protein n=1 Tax=Nelumbo nucifera TaxID=4432 RepID=A0A822YJA6_NELNU|nr:TPA_asm: hypothetical protein HUJ06_011511 [Nelumbo nucifera]
MWRSEQPEVPNIRFSSGVVTGISHGKASVRSLERKQCKCLFKFSLFLVLFLFDFVSWVCTDRSGKWWVLIVFVVFELGFVGFRGFAGFQYLDRFLFPLLLLKSRLFCLSEGLLCLLLELGLS